jgi:hypothetical protein
MRRARLRACHQLLALKGRDHFSILEDCQPDRAASQCSGANGEGRLANGVASRRELDLSSVATSKALGYAYADALMLFLDPAPRLSARSRKGGDKHLTRDRSFNAKVLTSSDVSDRGSSDILASIRGPVRR